MHCHVHMQQLAPCNIDNTVYTCWPAALLPEDHDRLCMLERHPYAGDSVTAGTVNCDGVLTVQAERAGGDTAMADIVRAVEAAQSRAAPVQRLADQVPPRQAC